MTPTLLVDGDVLLHQVCWRLVGHWREKCLSPIALEQARWDFDARLQTALDDTDAGDLLVCLSDDPDRNFRKIISSAYKQHRKGVRPPLYQSLLEHVREIYPTVMYPWTEGDDAIGIVATDFEQAGWPTVIATIDKDLKQIPGEHYNTDHRQSFSVSADEARRQFLRQCLTGDSKDGYGGCFGVGERRAFELLNAEGWVWPAVVCAYKERHRIQDQDGPWRAIDWDEAERIALTTARLAFVLRDGYFQSEQRGSPEAIRLLTSDDVRLL